MTDAMATEEERELEAKLRRVTLRRGWHQAAWRALRLVHRYRAEDSARGEDWRGDHRIVTCLARVRACRAAARLARSAA
jgi:hypothetical protein